MLADRQLKVLVVDGAEAARRVRSMLLAADGSPFIVHCAESLVSALDALAGEPFDIAVVEISLSDSDGLATFETIRRRAPGLPVVIHTGPENEALAVTAVKRGAQDCLIKGRITGQALVRVVQYSVMRQQGQAQAERAETVKARVVGIVAAKGGVGATTIAAHTAMELKRQTNGRVLLMDVDVSSTSAAFLMHLESKYTVADAAINLNRLDSNFLESVVAKGPEDLDVLQAPGTAGFVEPLCGERLRHVVRFARTVYNHVVIDLGRFNPVAAGVLPELSEIYLIATSGLAEMYEANRAARKMAELEFPSEHIRLVINRAPKGITLFGDDNAYVENGVGMPVSLTIFDCSREIDVAYAAGRFLDKALPLRKQLAQLVTRSLGVEEKAPAPKGLLGLLRLARAVNPAPGTTRTEQSAGGTPASKT